MRLHNFIAVLAAIADITGALQDIPSADTSFIARRAPLAKKPQPPKQPAQQPLSKPASRVSVFDSKNAGHRLRFMPRGDTGLVDHQNGGYDVYEGGFLEASRVREFSRVTHISGCSAVFFFNTVGKVSTAQLPPARRRRKQRMPQNRPKKQAQSTSSRFTPTPLIHSR